jgi:AcrR family transcriptional regulator
VRVERRGPLRRRARAPRLAPAARSGGILDGARDLFCANGYERTAVSEIAARLGVAEGTVFKYFPTKRALLLAVLERWYEEMFGDYARDLAGVAAWPVRLRVLIWRHLRSIRDNPQLCRLMFQEVRAAADYPGSRLHAMNRRYTQLLGAVVRDGIKAGAFRDDIPVAVLRDLVYGGIEHHAWSFLSGRGTLDVDAAADQITTLLCQGLVTPAKAGVQRLKDTGSRLAPG